MQCKAGAVICDIARPPNISKEQLERRPDVLVIGSGEVKLPGNPQYNFDTHLPEGVFHACLAETALLALEGRFENFTSGSQVNINQVREIYDLYRKHRLTLSGIRTHDEFITPAEIAAKRVLAEDFRAHPAKFQSFLAGQLQKEQIFFTFRSTGSKNSETVPTSFAGMSRSEPGVKYGTVWVWLP
jgi:hypothetical protein